MNCYKMILKRSPKKQKTTQKSKLEAKQVGELPVNGVEIFEVLISFRYLWTNKKFYVNFFVSMKNLEVQLE